MNNLNSVLLEGELVEDPVLAYTKRGSAFTTFIIKTRRFYETEEGDKATEESNFQIHTYNRQAEVCQEYLHAGRGVRVVGRLKQTGGGVTVIAEHVEFKPVYKKPEVEPETVKEG